jgi:hypothetical protein
MNCLGFSFQIAKDNSVVAVIASEAKQSIKPRKERVDCFVASLLAMTSSPHTTSARGAMRPSAGQSGNEHGRLHFPANRITKVNRQTIRSGGLFLF